MVSTFARVFSSLTRKPSTRFPQRLPLLNEISTSLSAFLSAHGQMAKKKALMRWYKRTPELTAFVNKVAADMTATFHFESVKEGDTGRNKILTANKFSQQIVLNKLMESQAVDMLVTGDGFGWVGKLDEKDIKDKIKEIVSENIFLEQKTRDSISKRVLREIKHTEGLADIDGIDEDILRPRKYRYVPSTTVEIIFDHFDILGYKHMVGVIPPIMFKPEEIVHYTLMNRDGKVAGFTPVESVIVQLELLRQMWQNLLSIHKNGGSPDKIIAIDNVQVSSPAFKRIEQQLLKYKQVEKKHGNMLFTGKIQVEDLQQLDQMQFKDSGLYITGLIAMQWGIPRSSIPFIIGGTNTKDDTGGNSERSYWTIIDKLQKTFAQTMNTQLWMPHFGVKLVFDNPFFQLDIQRQQAIQTKLNNIMQMDTVLSRMDKQVSDQKRLKLMGLTEKDTTEMKIEVDPMTGNTMNNQLPNTTKDSDDKKNMKKAKADEQASTIASRGKPTGFGKHWDNNADMEYKQIMNSNEELVDLRTFVKLYNQDKSYQGGMPPRIFLRQNEDFTTYKFKSSDFVYKVIIPTSELERNRIPIMNLGDNIFIL